MHVPTPSVEPPDVAGAIGRLIHPGRPRAVVRFTAEMLRSEFITAYPWSDHHGWAACN